MDSTQARESLREIRAREQQTLDAARTARWPWWYVGAMAGLWFAMLASLDLQSNAPYLALAVVAMSLLTARVARQTSVRLHPSRYTSRTVWLAVASVAGLLVLYTLVRGLMELADAALPSTPAGLAVAGVIVAGAPRWQRAFHTTIARAER